MTAPHTVLESNQPARQMACGWPSQMGTIKPNARRAHPSDSQPGLVTELTDNCGPAGHKLPLAIVLIAVITGLTEEPGWSGHASRP